MYRLITLVMSIALLLGALPVTAIATTEHCPDGWLYKVETGQMNTVVLPAGTVFCVKGSTDATGKLTSDGKTTMYEYLGNGHDVSYYVVYNEIVIRSVEGEWLGPCGDPRIRGLLVNDSSVPETFKLRWYSGKDGTKIVRFKTLAPQATLLTKWLWAKGGTVADIISDGVLLDRLVVRNAKPWGVGVCNK